MHLGEKSSIYELCAFCKSSRNKKLNNAARLFRAIAHAEYVHAGDHFRELKHLDRGFVASRMAVFGPGDTRKNLKLAIAGENMR